MGLALTTIAPPSNEPVTLAELKAAARVDIPDDDVYIASLGVAARRLIERTWDCALVSQTLLLAIDRFPTAGNPYLWQQYSWGYWGDRIPMTALSGAWWPDRAAVHVPRPPLQSVVSLQYYDPAGNLQTADPSTYQVDTLRRPGRIMPAVGQYWPYLQQRPDAVQITFLAGFGPATTATGGIAAGSSTVTPASMTGILAGGILAIDTGSTREEVAVTSVTSSTFTATFGQAHSAGCAISGIPETIRQAIMRTVAAWYQDRGDTTDALKFPCSARRLLMGEWSGEYY